MGDLIEGPSTRTEHVYTGSGGRRASDRKPESRFPSAFSIFLGCMLAFIVVMGGAAWNQSVESDRFSQEMEGRCFTTAVGAKGMVESSDERSKSLYLIFPSGLRESYPVKELDEIPCELVTAGEKPKVAIR